MEKARSYAESKEAGNAPGGPEGRRHCCKEEEPRHCESRTKRKNGRRGSARQHSMPEVYACQNTRAENKEVVAGRDEIGGKMISPRGQNSSHER